MRGHSLAVQSMCTFWICGWGPGFISSLGTFFLNKKRKKYFFSGVGWRTFMQQRTNNDVTGTHKQTTPPTTQPAPCTDPCTTTHARCGQPVVKMHRSTPPNVYPVELHDTAAKGQTVRPSLKAQSLHGQTITHLNKKLTC